MRPRVSYMCTRWHAYHCCVFFFLHDTATTEIYTLSLHDALPIFGEVAWVHDDKPQWSIRLLGPLPHQSGSPYARTPVRDRKSTRLNSSHSSISYAVFCLKKKKKLNSTPMYTNRFSSHVPTSLTCL